MGDTHFMGAERAGLHSLGSRALLLLSAMVGALSINPPILAADTNTYEDPFDRSPEKIAE